VSGEWTAHYWSYVGWEGDKSGDTGFSFRGSRDKELVVMPHAFGK